MPGLAAWNAVVMARMSVSGYPACFMNRARMAPLPLPVAPALEPPPPTAQADSSAARPRPPPAAITARRLGVTAGIDGVCEGEVGSMTTPFGR